jgi:hypothetical protein
MNILFFILKWMRPQPREETVQVYGDRFITFFSLASSALTSVRRPQIYTPKNQFQIQVRAAVRPTLKFCHRARRETHSECYTPESRSGESAIWICEARGTHRDRSNYDNDHAPRSPFNLIFGICDYLCVRVTSPRIFSRGTASSGLHPFGAERDFIAD